MEGTGQMKRCPERNCTSFAPPGYAFCGLHNMREPAEAKGTPIDDCAVCEETPCRGWPECAEERSEQYMARKREREEAFKSSLSLSEARELWVQWKRDGYATGIAFADLERLRATYGDAGVWQVLGFDEVGKNPQVLDDARTLARYFMETPARKGSVKVYPVAVRVLGLPR